VVQAPVFMAGGVCQGLARHEPIGAKSLLQKPDYADLETAGIALLRAALNAGYLVSTLTERELDESAKARGRSVVERPRSSS
jgi:hypothetical protein